MTPTKREKKLILDAVFEPLPDDSIKVVRPKRGDCDVQRLVGRHCLHTVTLPERFSDGKWSYKTDARDVILLAVVGPHAMVRRPGCAPYVAPVKELTASRA